MKFKAGDRVKCVDASESGGILRKDKIYTVMAVESPFIELEDGYNWYASRFVIGDPPKSGRLMV